MLQHQKQTAEALKLLGIDRRQYGRFKQKGTIRFQEHKNSVKNKVIKIGRGILADLSENGASFRINGDTITDNVSKMYREKYKAMLQLEGIAAPVKLLGEIVSFERGIYRRELANYHIIRMKFNHIDKNSLPVLKDTINKNDKGWKNSNEF